MRVEIDAVDIIFLVFFSSSLAQCKSKKKFRTDNKARLVNPNSPESPQSVVDVHRPVSQAPPTMTPIESQLLAGSEMDTMANVASIKPDFSTEKPLPVK